MTSLNNVNTTGFTNSGSDTGIAIIHSTVTGDVKNTGTLDPNGISLADQSTIVGSIVDSGVIVGGITIDGTSRIDTTNTAITINGTSFAGNVSNAGMISAAARGILVDAVPTFEG